MMPSDVGTCTWLVEELVESRIVDHERLLPCLEDFLADSPYADADAFAKHLVREGLLTRYQARRAVDGDSRKLLLGAYMLMDVIGSGSLGPVLHALGRADRKSYALRILPQRAWNVALARKQVLAFEDLPPHDRMVPFIDVGTAQGTHYLVWPLVKGRTLENIVRECGSRSAGEAARIGVEIAEVLKLCHGQGIVHGLIKPSNVLIAPDGQARLLDFGIGALLAENSEDDSLVDTVSRAEAIASMLECAAPESVADSSNWTPAGDQYSLGCTLYFTLTGRYPFAGGNFVDKMLNHQRNHPVPIRSLNPEVPPGFADVIDQLMRKIPGDRYRKLDDLIHDLVPLATVSRLREPVPVNVQTPLPTGKLELVEPANEPPRIELPPRSEKRGFLKRLFAGSAEHKPLQITVVVAGPVRSGETIVLHVYVHDPVDAERLNDAIRNHPVSPRIVGQIATARNGVVCEPLSLHLGVDGAAVADPLQEVRHDTSWDLCRFTVALPAVLQGGPLRGRLMVGQGGKRLSQLDFVLPVLA